jgi:hypothetical protein
MHTDDRLDEDGGGRPTAGGSLSESLAPESRGHVAVRPSRTYWTHELSNKFVYLYRDPSTFEIRYVGLATLRNSGSGRQRPEDHLDCKQTSCEVRPWVQRLRAHGLSPIIEVINCGDDEERAKAVEGALISALWGGGQQGLLNHIHGHGEKFRPLGSPRSVAGRRLLAPLSRRDVANLGPALVVNLSIKDFDDYETDGEGRQSVVRRPGAGTFSAVTDERVSDRIRRWWQLGRLHEEWMSGTRALPKLVIGITGPAAHKWVYGALTIDSARIKHMARWPEGLYELPVKPGVDARQLRGRRVAPYQFGPRTSRNGQVFGSNRNLQFDWVD